MESSSSQIPSRSDINDILKRKRKIREHKACYPCRKRKVRCDSQIPCKTCVDRGHADICAFNPPPKRVDSGMTHAGTDGLGSATVSIDKDDWERLCSKLNTVERSLSDLREDLRHVAGLPTYTTDDEASQTPVRGGHAEDMRETREPNGPKYLRAMEINEQSHLTGETVHLGGGSVPALVMALRNGAADRPALQEVFNNNRLLPLFGLENEGASYPFVNLWGPQDEPARINELMNALPGDAECMQSFRSYREGAFITYPGIVEIDQFETDLVTFLMNRQHGSGDLDHGAASDRMYGYNLQWVGLLFAAFASGAQFTALPKKERDLISQVYVCCSFECLRLVNYLSKPSLENVQTLLLLGNVLSNAFNSGLAWTFLGTTIRSAQALGLHRMPETPELSPRDVTRSKVWWVVLWQDSILSVPYDRGAGAYVEAPFPPDEPSDRGGKSYRECMYRVCKVGLAIVRNRMFPQSIESRLARCKDLRDEIKQTQAHAADHLRDYRNCRSINDQIEYWALALHSSYMGSELCRPAISPTTARFEPSNEIRRLCLESLMDTVEAYLGLANVSPIYARPWAVMHRALSAGLLLGILGEPTRNAKAQALLGKLITVLREMASITDASEHLNAISRSMSALHKLSAPESRTPAELKFEQPASAGHVVAHHPLDSGNVPPTPDGVEQNFTMDEAGIDLAFENAFYLPYPRSGFEDESSPYALMNSIIGTDQWNLENKLA